MTNDAELSENVSMPQAICRDLSPAATDPPYTGGGTLASAGSDAPTRLATNAVKAKRALRPTRVTEVPPTPASPPSRGRRTPKAERLSAALRSPLGRAKRG